MDYLIELEVKCGDDPMLFTDFLYGDAFGLRLAANEAQRLLSRQPDASEVVVYLSRNDQLVNLWELAITQDTSIIELLTNLDLDKHIRKGKHENKRTDSYGSNSYGAVCQPTA